MAASMSSEVEHDDCRDPFVGVDLGDAERLALKCFGPWSRPEHRTRPRTRRWPRVAMRSTKFRGTPKSVVSRMSAITASRPSHSPAFTTRRRSSSKMSSASISAIAVPVPGREVRQEALGPLGLPRFPAAAPAGVQFIEAGERGVEVCLVEELDAVDQVARRRSRSATSRHSASKPSLRRPVCRMRDDRAEVVQPVHGLD